MEAELIQRAQEVTETNLKLQQANEELKELYKQMQESERIKLQESEEKFRSAMLYAATGMAIFTPDGKWLQVNRAICDILGYSEEELLATDFRQLTFPEDLPQDEIYVSKFSSREIESTQYEKRFVHKNGSLVWVHVSASLVWSESGEPLYYIAHFQDITPRKKTDQVLLKYMHELEISNQELDDFAYIASHDLKEPLRGLYNHASFLIEDYKDKLDEDGVKRLNRLSYLAEKLEGLVNDLLYFARLGRAEMSIQEADPNTIITEIEQLLEPMLKAKNTNITIPEPLPRITCDKTRITEVFRNLITNAMKYNDKKDPLIEVGFLKKIEVPEGAEKDVFYVRDNGIGIAPQFHHEIFRIFRRLNRADGIGDMGTGSGLTFVKKIVERHGGQVWLDSVPGEGTTFYFNLKGGGANDNRISK